MQRTQFTIGTLISTVHYTELVNSRRLVADSLLPYAVCQTCYVLQYFPHRVLRLPEKREHTS